MGRLTSTIEELLPLARERFSEMEIARVPLEILPLLEEYRKRKRIDLSNIEVFFLQHHLAPFHARVRAMERQGLEGDRSWFVDIPYSTNLTVWRKLARGHTSPLFSNPLLPYNEWQKRRVFGMMYRLADRPRSSRVIVIDDGAYFMKELAHREQDTEFCERFRGALVVEQTTRGHRFLESAQGLRLLQRLGIVAVSVARTGTKVRMEAPFIGTAVGRSIRKAVAAQETKPKRVLIIGFGSVGEATLRELRRTKDDRSFTVVDPNEDRLAVARELGCEVLPSLPRAIQGDRLFDLVVGCTGGTSFTWEHRHILARRAVLASGSSAAVELDRERLVDRANASETDSFELLTRKEDGQRGTHTDLHFAYGRGAKRKHFTILNGGFPVNFNGAPEHIPTIFIEPTHTLLYAAAAQALQERSPGLHILHPLEDNWILEQACRNIQASLQ
jgi:voltage-gated potassium channel Kch